MNKCRLFIQAGKNQNSRVRCSAKKKKKEKKKVRRFIMKKIMALLVLCLALPALATVTITAVDQGGGVVAINYAVSDANLVRAFALDISVTGGAKIMTLVAASYKTNGASTAASKGYGIYPGTIDINSTTGVVNAYGTPVAPAADPGAAGALGSAAITLELGSVYKGDANKPATSGTLCKLTVDKTTTICAVLNATRGGIVMEKTTLTPTVNLFCNVAITVSGCACWGDIYGPSGVPDGKVSTSDMSKLLGLIAPYKSVGYIRPTDPQYVCMDIYGPSGKVDGKLSTSDMSKLLSYLAPYKSVGYVRPCLPTPVFP